MDDDHLCGQTPAQARPEPSRQALINVEYGMLGNNDARDSGQPRRNPEFV